MPEIMQNQGPGENAKPLPIAIFAAVLLLAGLAAILWLVFQSPQRQSSQVAQTNLPKMSAEETAYAQNIRIENVALSRAENFLHQEVTILKADAVNAGSLPVQALSVTIEFFDDMHQVVLRESRIVLGPQAPPLGPGQTKNFEISFDRLPSSWNMQQPSVKASYLRLADLK